jgi:hypothetical protein
MQKKKSPTSVKLPDPKALAREEAARIRKSRDEHLKWPLDRILADSPFADREQLLSGLEAFHRERMEKVPPARKYPESKVWVDHILTVDREVKQLAGLSDRDMALLRSLNDYCRFRGFARMRAPSVEKCRVAYIPESDHGRIHFKNVDDPNTYWKPEPRPTWLFSQKGQTLWSDGVGSGLHLDDEPSEIFPLLPTVMFRHYCDDVPSSVEFLTRYSPFWGNANVILHDSKKRSAAIEKCSRNFIEVFPPDSEGRNHISGMTCRDPNSPQGRYQRAQRQKYLKQFGLTDENCADGTFWDLCAKLEGKLARGLESLSKPAKLDELIRLFTGPWPEGLNKAGAQIHPKQGLRSWTLISYCVLPDEGKLRRWQRSALPECKFPDKPEIFTFDPVPAR